VKTTLTARNLEITARLRAEIERKLRRLDRVADHRGAEANVALIAHASHASEQANVAEVTLHANGSVLRSTSSGPTPMAAFDTVLDKLERQAVRTKQRRRSVRERAADEVNQVLAREAVATTLEGPAEPGGPSVVKIKRFDMVPMFEEDAISRMEELGHAFFVFFNAESEQIAVLYRRRDGDYGVIEPVIEARGRGR
jgi:putative sigma-54 modulation protein